MMAGETMNFGVDIMSFYLYATNTVPGTHRCSMENGRPPDPADWAVMDVVNYFRTVGFEEQASAFQEQEIDGKSLLLMTRNDVLTGLQLKLGPALKIYEYHVKPLQTKHLKNNSS
ncbi:sterile alpha motif domain-containing protein 13 isoform X3 [Macaca fascicularis]|uniref:sterile alpha motif domain-containing protein 13 isoform X3 n=1 Tax=Macaca fascicularis TaxID=9541 RepID=UPI001E257F0E|nr:sterile alpha motif domain-containing protein 13 isoform X4 [Macaca fascicularis]